LPAGPLGPNGLLALGDPRTFHTLPWKTLHHWQFAHRQQMADQQNLGMSATNRQTPVHPVSNPAWNSGNTMLSPIVVHYQMLISFNAIRRGLTNDYDLYLYGFPVITIWNPYNVPLKVDGLNLWTARQPLEHTLYVNEAKRPLTGSGSRNGVYAWEWRATSGTNQMVGGANPVITMAPGEARLFSFSHPVERDASLREAPPAWTPLKPGRQFHIGTVNGPPTTRISIGTACATWDVSGSAWDFEYPTTFELRSDNNWTIAGQGDSRYLQQQTPSLIAWRHEASNPRPDTISKWNKPNSTLADLTNNPQPFLLLDARLKTFDEKQLPNKNWLHNIPSNPFVAATSTAKHSPGDPKTPFFAHPYTVTYEQVNGIEGVFQSRPYFGSSNRPGGQEKIVAAPFPLAPLTSIPQLQNLPLLPIDALNRSGYHYQNLAVGNSFASPGLAPDQIRGNSYPFFLGEWFHYGGGDITGKTYGSAAPMERKWFNKDEYSLSHAPPRILDRSYIANQLLFDDYFFSSMAAQQGPVFSRYGAERALTAVIGGFLDGTTPLPVTAYQPYLSNSETPSQTKDLLVRDGKATADAYRLVASRLLANGGFNINSASVEAWTAILSAAKKKRPVTMPGGTSLRAEERGEHVISRNPNPPLADDSDDSRWLGYRQLTDAQIRELAGAVVRQVKKRGPFRSLGEFVNRRLTTDRKLALYGAIQAALEDPEVSINADYRGGGKELTATDIAGTNYEFPEAALGSRYQGTPAYINQADILTPIAPVIQARSDTFVVRGYGEARSPDGTRILARAWCEAVVQRVPDYLDAAADPTETPYANLQSPVNRRFGRRFHITSFRWLPGGAM
jgi:hypothetical protein